jgi:TPP-dependent pyruvate/acetoin dehydrogenase alpha subunit
VWAELRVDIAAAIEFAEASPLPDADQLLVDVYTETTPVGSGAAAGS